VFDEVLLVLGELLPVLCVLTQIDFINGPETSHLIFVHLPDVFILDGEDHEPVWIFLEEWLGQYDLGVLALAWRGDVLWRDDLRFGATICAVMLVQKLGGGHLRGGLL
jgi:hypothetical protein